MKIIGITGGAGAGKSQILLYLKEKHEASVCQADEVAKKLQKKGKQCYDDIVSHFGKDILKDNGSLDREKLSGIVFTDEKERAALNRIVHPAVKEEIQKMIEKEKKKDTRLFVLEAALLIEDHYDEICDELWYIYADETVRKNRLVYSRNYDPQKVEDLFSSQLKKEEFLKRCDRVVDNSGLFEESMLQVDDMIGKLFGEEKIHI